MKLVWELLESITPDTMLRNAFTVRRAKVPGGWLIAINNPNGASVTFYPDPNHKWDGSSLP